jgi:hypothetical protein
MKFIKNIISYFKKNHISENIDLPNSEKNLLVKYKEISDLLTSAQKYYPLFFENQNPPIIRTFSSSGTQEKPLI